MDPTKTHAHRPSPSKHIVTEGKGPIMTQKCSKPNDSTKVKRTGIQTYCLVVQSRRHASIDATELIAYQPSPLWYIFTENEGEIMTLIYIRPNRASKRKSQIQAYGLFVQDQRNCFIQDERTPIIAIVVQGMRV